MKKLLLTIFTAMLVLATVFTVNDTLAPEATAAEIIDSGICGDNVTWTLDDNHVLRIDGTGDMTQPISLGQYYSDIKVIIGSEITSICDMFAQYANIVDVTFEGNSKLKVIGEDAFCIAEIEEISIPDSVEIIGKWAFKQCDDLKIVRFGENSKLKEIHYEAFGRCRNLETINLPDSIEVLAERAFMYCTTLKEVALGDNLTLIGESAFSGCENLQKVIISPDSKMTEIGENAFNNCYKLSEFNCPESVITIGDGAFNYCAKLQYFDIPEKAEYVGYGAFAFSGVKELNVSATAEYFGPAYNAYLEKYIVSPDNKYYSTDEYGVLYNKEKTVLLDYPLGSTAKEYIIPDSVTTIATYAFSFGKNLEKVVMSDNVTEIQQYAFAYNMGIKEIVMSKNVKVIGDCSFIVCLRLEHIEIPAGVEELSDSEFAYAYSLKDIKIYNRNLDITGTLIGVLEFYGSDTEREEFIEILIDSQYYGLNLDEDYIIEKYGSIDEFMAQMDYFISQGDTVVKDHYTVYCYKDSVAESYLKENGIKYAYLCDHVEEEIPAVAPTCTLDGMTAGVKCSLCGDVLVAPEVVAKKGHKPEVLEDVAPENGLPGVTGLTVCSECGSILDYGQSIPPLEDDTEPECDHMCHNEGALRILWKIINFFSKLFGVNPVCECGAAHY